MSFDCGLRCERSLIYTCALMAVLVVGQVLIVMLGEVLGVVGAASR